jgi:hypothetical protein
VFHAAPVEPHTEPRLDHAERARRVLEEAAGPVEGLTFSVLKDPITVVITAAGVPSVIANRLADADRVLTLARWSVLYVNEQQLYATPPPSSRTAL